MIIQKFFSTSLIAFSSFILPSSFAASDIKIDGIYKMPIRIGERVFEDLVVLQSKDDGSLEGSVTVPGNFTAKIVSGKVASLSNAADIQFDIAAIERGNPLNVSYRGKIKIDPSTKSVSFAGQAFDLESNEAFGNFEAVLLRPVR